MTVHNTAHLFAPVTREEIMEFESMVQRFHNRVETAGMADRARDHDYLGTLWLNVSSLTRLLKKIGGFE